MAPAIVVRILALAALCGGLCHGPAVAAGPPSIVLAGANGGVCAAQLEKCIGRCFGSSVCASRCAANDRACRVGAKPVYR
jgi:hypothetical protein